MHQFKLKLKLIFLPYLLIAFFTIFIYNFLYWLLIIRIKALVIDEKWGNFFIPLALAFIPLVIWLRPRIKLLKLNFTGRRDPVFLLIMLTGFTIVIPTIVGQFYLETATGKLTPLDSIGLISELPATKYYTVRHFYINKRLVHVKPVFTVSGKGRTDFNMSLYAVVPIFNHIYPDTNKIAAMRKAVNPQTLVLINDKISTMDYLKKLPADSIRLMRYVNPSLVMPKYGKLGKYGALAIVTRSYKLATEPAFSKFMPVAWLAVNYSKSINNSLSPAAKDLQFKQFLAHCDTDFRRKRLDKFIYLGRFRDSSDDLRHDIEAVKTKDDFVGTEAPIILFPSYEPFSERNGNKLAWISWTFAIGSIIFLLVLMCYRLRNIKNIESINVWNIGQRL